jgi:hypothetical protein
MFESKEPKKTLGDRLVIVEVLVKKNQIFKSCLPSATEATLVRSAMRLRFAYGLEHVGRDRPILSPMIADPAASYIWV